MSTRTPFLGLRSNPPSRPASPVPFPPSTPDPSQPRARPLTRLQNPFRRPSSLPPPPSAATGPNIIPPKEYAGAETYVDRLGLKLSEAVSKALASPTPAGVAATANGAALNNTAALPGDSALFKGKKPIPPGRGTTLGALIQAELESASHDSNLHRAILRILHRPLSVLLTNLSAHILPLLPYISPPFPSSSPPNPTTLAAQTHALALSSFCLELLQTFDTLSLGIGQGVDRDGLRGVRETLETLVKRVVGGLLDGLKAEITGLLDPMEAAPPPIPSPPISSTALIHNPSSSSFLLPGSHKPPTPPLPDPIANFATHIPSISQRLAKYASACPPAKDSGIIQTLLAGFLIKVMWKAVLTLSMRPLTLSASTEQLTPPTTSSGLKPRRSTGPDMHSYTPPSTPPSLRFTSLLPSLSRPPSPPLRSRRTLSGEVGIVSKALREMVRPKEGTVAAEAVSEARDVCNDFEGWVKKIEPHPRPLQANLEEEEEDVPMLLMLNVLLASQTPARRVGRLLGLDEGVYREGWMSGFGRADECAGVVGRAVVDVLERERVGEDVVAWIRARLD